MNCGIDGVRGVGDGNVCRSRARAPPQTLGAIVTANVTRTSTLRRRVTLTAIIAVHAARVKRPPAPAPASAEVRDAVNRGIDAGGAVTTNVCRGRAPARSLEQTH